MPVLEGLRRERKCSREERVERSGLWPEGINQIRDK